MDFPPSDLTGAGEASYSAGTRHGNREDYQVGGGESYRSGKRVEAPSRRKFFSEVEKFIRL